MAVEAGFAVGDGVFDTPLPAVPLGAPGVVSTLRLPCEPQPDTTDRSAPPGLALHLLDEHTGDLTTHVRTIGS